VNSLASPLFSFRRSLIAAALITTLWIFVRLGLAARFGVPVPVVHDEFSYLLQADIFAHGRLVKPAHPMGRFFESPNILVRPVYASKYPPGQSLVLAFGQSVFGSPFYGVVAEGALEILTLCLMLCAWVPFPWAMVVTVIFAASLQPPHYWVSSYYGGCLAASGGALILLAIGVHRGIRTMIGAAGDRVGWKRAWICGPLFAAGAVLLALTRPFEGAVFTAAALAVYGYELWSSRRTAPTFGPSSGSWAIALAAAPIMIGGIVGTLYYNKQVTGNALLMPYVLHDRQYEVIPRWWFMPLRPEPTYSNSRLAALDGANGWEVSIYNNFRPWWRGLARGCLAAVSSMAESTRVGWLALLVPLAWRDPRYRQLLALVVVSVPVLSTEVGHLHHYYAPFSGVIVILTGVWLECAWKLRFRKIPVGRAMVWAIVCFSLAGCVRNTFLHGKPGPEDLWATQRAALVRRISSLGRPQLVFVSYPSPGWDLGEEWVYNGADIDAQPVIFAHDLGRDQNGILLQYYSGRQAWVVSVEAGEYRISPCTISCGANPSQ
jgi:hypothetical protein